MRSRFASRAEPAERWRHWRPEDRALAWRLAGLGLAGALFYGLEWTALRRALGEALAAVLTATGLPSAVETAAGTIDFVVHGSIRTEITAECTYVDLILCLLPFLWRAHLAWGPNLGRLAAAAAAVAGADLLRLTLLHHALVRGAGWTWAHDVPDTLLWYPTLALAVLAALRADQRRAREPRRSAMPFMAKEAVK